ncbi:hypothetical protein VTJ04DRAFT_6203 [Mycothermus thermophilus]|uniref:uncharacterized protein n=1 Tax=Humicola insolens TaxID=85995 RepID=UPI0037439C32
MKYCLLFPLFAGSDSLCFFFLSSCYGYGNEIPTPLCFWCGLSYLQSFFLDTNTVFWSGMMCLSLSTFIVLCFVVQMTEGGERWNG